MADLVNLTAVEPVPRRGLITRICNHPIVLRLGRLLQLRKIADGLLRRAPIWISDRNGVKRKVDSVEAIFAAEEIMSCPIYRNIDPWLPDIRSFIDLGMNRGYFVLYLHSATLKFRKAGESLSGVAVEANPSLLDIARLNLKANHLDLVYARQGAAGATEEVSFYLNAEDTNSSIFETDAFGRSGNHSGIIRVPPICIAKTWSQLFGTMPCDLLKIDIEGSERLFLELEADFVRDVKYVVVEYHGTLSTSREAIKGELEKLGFEIVAHEANTATIGVLFARRLVPAANS